MNESVLYDRKGHIVTLSLNRPETRNALTDSAVAEALIAGCERANADMGVRVVILTGQGPAFSSGGNIKHMRDREGIFAGSAQDIQEAYRHGIQRVARALFALEVPTIAAVNGPAYGAGCDAAMACDLRIASETAVFAENFVKLGLISGFGGSWLLPRIVGSSRAAEMTFTGEPIDAATAVEWGLVSAVVQPEELMPVSMDLARRIAANPPAALRMAKRLMRQSALLGYESVLEMAAGLQATAHGSEDHREAIAAALEKRAGHYTGA